MFKLIKIFCIAFVLLPYFSLAQTENGNDTTKIINKQSIRDFNNNDNFDFNSYLRKNALPTTLDVNLGYDFKPHRDSFTQTIKVPQTIINRNFYERKVDADMMYVRKNVMSFDYNFVERMNIAKRINIYGIHNRQTFPLLANVEQTNAVFAFNASDNITLYGNVYAAKYSIHNTLHNDFGIGAGIEYKISNKIIIYGAANYSMRNNKGRKIPFRNDIVPQSFLASGIIFKLGKNFDIDVGFRLRWDLQNGSWGWVPATGIGLHYKLDRKSVAAKRYEGKTRALNTYNERCFYEVRNYE